MMEMTASEAEQLIREGLDAMRRGDSISARKRFEEAIQGNTGAANPSFLLAQACRNMGDHHAVIAALDHVLTEKSDNIGALLMMGEAKAGIGDDRGATSYFKSGLRFASLSSDIPSALHPLLNHAQSWLERSQKLFADHLRQHLFKNGMESFQPPRVQEALSLLLGEKELFVQQPTMFYFPGLPQRQFYEREEFEWVAKMEQQVPAMRQELDDLLNSGQEFSPYITTAADRPKSINPLVDDNKWSAWYFWENGSQVIGNTDLCPRTSEVLTWAPMPTIVNRSPMALYSVLKADTHIIPHHGALNTRLICHIPLMVPEGCALRCGSETRSWEMGKTLIFDDSIEHEAWNKGNETRIVLLFDIWRPEISVDEREALTVIFEAVDHYGLGDINA